MPGAVSNLLGATAPTTGAGAPGTNPQLAWGSYTNPNGTSSMYDPSNNYADSGMSYQDYTSKYGTPEQQAGAGSAAGAAAWSAGNNQANNPAVNPNLGLPSLTATSGTAPTYGTQSGPGILQQWFNERANGTDPGYEYATGRGLTALNNQYDARGAFDSGASEQGDSDYLANMGSQREGQLDTLASGASNEYANQISQMLGAGMGLGSGEAGTAGQYDTGAAANWANSMNTGLSLAGQSAMIPYLARQQMMQNLMGLGGGLVGSLL